MTFTLRKATRAGTPVIIGLSGASGSGKTYSALQIVKGLAEGGTVAFVDTESGRAGAYAERFDFMHGVLDAPFAPDRYVEAIEACEKAGARVIVVDSMSHSHDGEGGMIDQHEAALDRMAGNDWKKREACNMRAWVDPKTQMKRMVQRLLRSKAHIICCLRAQEKMTMGKNSRGKTEIVSSGYQPIMEKKFAFELLLNMMLDPENPGKPHHLKQHIELGDLVPEGQLITEETGRRIAQWAEGQGGGQSEREEQPPAQAESPAPDLEEVLAGISVAETMKDLMALRSVAALLPENDKPAARDAFAKRKAEIS